MQASSVNKDLGEDNWFVTEQDLFKMDLCSDSHQVAIEVFLVSFLQWVGWPKLSQTISDAVAFSLGTVGL